MNKNLVKILHDGGYSCVIAKGNEVRTFIRRGVADLYDLYNTDPGFMEGAAVADKVIGKGAAALLVLGKVKSVYTDVISAPALRLLHKAHIDADFIQEVPFIVNRDKTGYCPLESACSGIDNAEDMYPDYPGFSSSYDTRGRGYWCYFRENSHNTPGPRVLQFSFSG